MKKSGKKMKAVVTSKGAPALMQMTGRMTPNQVAKYHAAKGKC